jgi:peroxiredoxin
MVTSICLLTCALTVGQVPDRAEWQLSPQLLAGMELVYSGTYLEEDLSPNVNHQRRYHLDTTMFVLEARRGRWDVAFMTSLSLREPSRESKISPKEQPMSVRLELATLDEQGHLSGTVPLAIPISGPPTLECGIVVETKIARLGRDQFWEINEEGRPPRTWQVAGPESCNGITCVKLIGNQQSDDWDRPRGDHTAWRRRDTVWVLPKLGVAQKVERVIERRQPARRDPTDRTTVRYELESRLPYPGRMLEDRRQEILKAKRFQDDARPLLAQPGVYRPQIEALLRKIAYYLESQAPTPYRKAVATLQSHLEKARRGETPPESIQEEETTKIALGVGQRVPDFIVTNLTGKESARLARVLGRPVFVFFYNPLLSPSKEALRFAVELHQKYGDHVGIMAMAVTDNPEIARKQHAELRLPFAVLDGKGLHLTFGVDDTPRLIVLDGEGILRFAATGWGIQTPEEITEELVRCMAK